MGKDNSVTTLKTGNDHSVAMLKTGNGHSVTTLKTGNDHNVTTLKTGNNHSVTTLKTGNDHSVTTLKTGNDNIVTTLKMGNDHDVTVLKTGNNHGVTTLKTGHDHSVTTLKTGNDHSVTTFKAGNDHSVTTLKTGNCQIVTTLKTGNGHGVTSVWPGSTERKEKEEPSLSSTYREQAQHCQWQVVLQGRPHWWSCVKVSIARMGDPGAPTCHLRSGRFGVQFPLVVWGFFCVESYQWLRNWHSSHVRYTLKGQRWTGWPSVSILWLGEVEIWSAASISEWQHVNLSEQFSPCDTLACCWVTKQPTKKPTNCPGWFIPVTWELEL